MGWEGWITVVVVVVAVALCVCYYVHHRSCLCSSGSGPGADALPSLLLLMINPYTGDAHSVCNNLNLCKALYSPSVWNVEYVAEGQLNNTGGAFLAHTIFIFFCNLFCCLLN